MQNQYKINGLDVYATWGLTFQDGSVEELLKFPQRKQGYSYNWPDENGTERDVTNPFYESRELSFNILLIGTNKTDFLTKLEAFKQYIAVAGYFFLDCLAITKRYRLLYNNMSGFKQLGMTGARFTLHLVDDFPTETFPI